MDIDSDDEDWDFKSTQRLKKSKGFTRTRRQKNERCTNNSSVQKFPKLKTLVDIKPYNKLKRLKGPHDSEPKCKRNAKGSGQLESDTFSSKTLTESDSECIVIEELGDGDSLSCLQDMKVDKHEEDGNAGGKEIKEIDTNAIALLLDNRKKIDNFKSKGKRSPRKANPRKKLLITPPRKIHEGYCPFCQMPFGALIIQSPNWHTMECMDLPMTSTTECPDGLKCNSTLQSHYRRFSHTLLAQSRARNSPANLENQAANLEKSAITLHTKACEFNTECTPDQFMHYNSSGVCDIGKKRGNLTPNTSSSPSSKLKSNNSKRRRSLLKNPQHSGNNITKFFSGSSQNKSNLDFGLTGTNEQCSQETYKQRNLDEEADKEFIDLDDSSDVESEITVQKSDNMLINSDTVASIKNTLELDEGLGDPMHLLMESDTDVDSVGSEDASRYMVKAISEEGLSYDAKGSKGTIESGTSLAQGDSNAFEFVVGSDIAKNLEAQFSEDDEAQTESRSAESVERPDTQVTETVSSLEDDVSVGDFDENLDCSDIETPEMLEDGSIKVKHFFADKHFPTNSEVSLDSSKQEETLPAVISSNNSKSVCDKSLTNNPVGATIGDPVTALMNAKKQTSLFGFFQNVSCKKTTGTGSEKQKLESGMDPGKSAVKSHKSVSNVNNSHSFGVKDTLFVQRKSGSKVVSGENPKGAVLTNDVSEVKMNYTELATDVQNPQEGYKGRKYNCPFYKKIPDTSITVDAFRYGNIPGCKAYVLTHFHYDHYGGLTKHFCQPLYCSKVTGNLVKSKIKVSEKYINILPMNKPCVVEDVELTLMEANHCPGAVIILFRLRDGRAFLHTGDFRASSQMEEYSPLVGVPIDLLYLDTTYCDPTYVFPSQRDVIEFAVGLVQNTLQDNPRTLIVCGTYTIGKEKIFLAIAEAIDSKIGVARDKKVILDCLEDDRLSDRITLDLTQSQVHVLPMAKLRAQTLAEHLFQYNNFTHILALEPTGWTYSKKSASLDQIRPKYNKNNITIYGIPYSEHSSYSEMKRFTQFIQPCKILPTVNNGNPQSRKKMEAHFKSWMDELDNPVSSDPVKKQSFIDQW